MREIYTKWGQRMIWSQSQFPIKLCLWFKFDGTQWYFTKSLCQAKIRRVTESERVPLKLLNICKDKSVVTNNGEEQS